jgi:hypothetical protein
MAARACFPSGVSVALHVHDGAVTVHDRTGRIVAVDPTAGQVIVTLTLRE